MIFADPPYFLSGGGKTIRGKRVVSVNKGDWDTVRTDEESFEPELMYKLFTKVCISLGELVECL